jgi:hypothetical protein
VERDGGGEGGRIRSRVDVGLFDGGLRVGEGCELTLGEEGDR